MSIEDVYYLQHHCTTDSVAFYVDSSFRDRTMYPTPSEYAVQFEEPFRLVYGFEVLDSAIPSTMYNVDYNNNMLALTTLSQNDSTVDIVDLMADLRWVPKFVTAMEYAANSADILIVRDTDWAQLPPGLDVTIEPPTDQSFWSVVAVWSTVDGVDVLDNRMDLYTGNPDYVVLDQTPSLAVPAAAAASALAATGADNLVAHDPRDGSGYVLYAYKTVWVLPATITYIRETMTYVYDLRNAVLFIEKANYDILSLMSQLQIVLSPWQISIGSTTSGTVDMAAKYNITCINDVWVDMQKSTMSTVMGFNLDAVNDDPNGTYTTVPWAHKQLFRGLYNGLGRTFNIISPGVVNLSGIPYMVLRCPEIEQHTHSFSYMRTNTGLGVLKLASTNDVTHLRFDFVNMIRKPFHPIGKLTRLTLRFELSDGSLYDFKGTDHQMLMTVRYYTPHADVKAPKSLQSVLNPEYNPDFLEYLVKYMPDRSLPALPETASDEEDDDDDDEND